MERITIKWIKHWQVLLIIALTLAHCFVIWVPAIITKLQGQPTLLETRFHLWY